MSLESQPPVVPPESTGPQSPSGSPPISASSSAQPEILPFQFTGTGGEFFRIWIVNILLSIVTLGIYSAWAKVRTNRYIYGNTSVAGGHFDYHANPLVILKGRVIAIVLLLLYTLLTEFLPIVGLVMLVALLIALPFVVVRALRFNARMSSWRNIRFNFIGETGPAFGAYLGWPLLGVMTFGLGMPWAWYKKAEYGVNNHRLGRSLFSLGAQPGDFYMLALVLLGFALLAVIFFVTLISAVGGLMAAADGDGAGAIAATIGFVLGALAYLAMFSLFSALRFRLVYQDLALEENRVTNTMSIAGYLWVAVTNTIAMLFTLGLFYPWAKIRVTRFLLDSLQLEAVDVDTFVEVSEEEQSAFGEELGDAFDLGIGV